MVHYLFALPMWRVRGYADTTSLVDVSVVNEEGMASVVTFDPFLLPSHLQRDFLTQLFEWAKAENVWPMSSFGTWRGSSSDSKVVLLLPLYLAWLEGNAHEHNDLE